MALSTDSKSLLNMEGLESVKGKNVGIIATEWNDELVAEQIKGAKKIADSLGINLIITYVPGSVELTFGIKQFEKKHQLDAIIAFGAVIKGGTPHFDYVCKSVTEGILALNLLLEIPVIFGVLTLDNIEQAWERLEGAHGHKGEEAMITAAKMIKFNQD